MLILASLFGMMALGGLVLLDPASPAQDTDELPPDTKDGAEEESHRVGDTSRGLLEYIDDAGEVQEIPNTPTDGDDLLIGTNDADAIDSGDGTDKIMAGGGADWVLAGGGQDFVHGGNGDDALYGGNGDDDLHGEAGDDLLVGDDGNDSLSGHGGNDVLYGQAGHDSLIGGEGNDLLEGQDGDDTLEGGAGHDTLAAGSGINVVFGGDGNDVLDSWAPGAGTSGSGDDFLNGGAGNDTVFADAGDDVSGGEGADDIHLRADADGPARIWDFESREDALVVFYDAGSDAPQIEIRPDPDTAGHWTVHADGNLIADVSGSQPVASDVSLVPDTGA